MGGDDNVRVKAAFKILCLRVRSEDLGERGTFPQASESPIWPTYSGPLPSEHALMEPGVCPPWS